MRLPRIRLLQIPSHTYNMFITSIILVLALLAAGHFVFPNQKPSLQQYLQLNTSTSAATFQSLPSLPNVSISSNQLEPKQKVFVIGLSKTGTTSLGDALAQLSYRRVGWQDIRSRYLFRSWIKQDLSPLIIQTQNHDAFEDLPWALVYAEMAALYPDAKFILTLRKSEEAWLKSIRDHTARRIWAGHEIVYGAESVKGHEAAYLEAYRNHTESVRKFFSSPAEKGKGRLLEYVIDAPETTEEKEMGERWGVLLRFLRLDDGLELRRALGEFPKSNPKTSWNNRDPLKVWWALDRAMYYGEEVIVKPLELLNWLTVITAKDY